MTAKRSQRISFLRFCTEVLRLDLTVSWRALLRVTIDGVQPRDLDPDEREAARLLFGDAVDEIDPRLRRVLVWRLGRAAGKTTIAAALAIWAAQTCSLAGVGRGQVPCAFVVSPSKPLARIMIGIARELVRDTEVDRCVVDDASESFSIRRPDGRTVEIRCVAASRGGANLRGRDVIVLVLDESEFFAGTEDGYAVSDRDQISAAMPRLLEFALMISTPWPSDNCTADYFDRNFGHPIDAVVALGPSTFMRPTPRLTDDIAREMARDAENADREFNCVSGSRGSSRLFDADSLAAAVVADRDLVIHAPSGARIGAGGDLAFERDSSAIAIAGLVGDAAEILEFDEIRPTRGAPLAPSFVIGRFAEVMRSHGARNLLADAHYRASATELLRGHGFGFDDAPAGQQGKYDVHMHFRALLRASKLRLPDAPRLVSQLGAIVSSPMPGGGVKISSPRRAGGGHGDIASAAVLAVWAAQRGPRAGGGGGPRRRPISTYRSDMDGFGGSSKGDFYTESGSGSQSGEAGQFLRAWNQFRGR